MKRDFISFLWIEPSSVSHLSWVFWSKVSLKCVQNMHTPDQEAVKMKEQLWGEGCLLGAWSSWPGVAVALWPSIGHFSTSGGGLKRQRRHLGHPDNGWEVLQHSSPLPRGLTWEGKGWGVQGLCLSVRVYPLWAGRGGWFTRASPWPLPGSTRQCSCWACAMY